MTIPSKPSYSPGSTGTEPSSSLDYANGDELNADHFDYYLHTEFDKIKGIIDALEAIDGNDDGVVDEADYANDADASTYKGTDIDTDGDGIVNQADHATTADDADTLDGVQLANINWSDTALAQSDVSLSDIGIADSDLDMGGNDIRNTGGVVLPVGTDQYVTS